MLLAFCVLLALRFANIHLGYEQIKQIPEGEMVIVTGKIYKKDLKKEGYLYYIKNTDISSATGDSLSVNLHRAALKLESDAYRIGDEITIEVSMRWMDRAANTGTFDESVYYHSLGIAALFYAETEPIILETGFAPVRNGLFYLRQRMENVFEENLNSKDAGILSSMILGDKSLMEEEMKTLYTTAGISHILAVSGLHVSIIGMSLFRLLRKSRRNYLISCSVSAIVLLLFCIMSGLSVSALRAGIMFLVFLGAQLLGRKYNSLRGLILSAVITIFLNPGYLYNVGFLFSYFAVGGVIGYGALLTTDKKKKAGKAFQSVWVSCSIMFATLPLTAYFYYEIPVYSVIANFFVLPLAGILMGFGLLGGVLGMTGMNCAWISFLPCHGILLFYEIVCNGIAFLPGEQLITGRPSICLLVFYYILFLSCSCYLHHKKRDRQSVRKSTMLLTGVLLFSLCFMFGTAPSKQMQISYLDVGQGDGIFINGGDGNTFFIDGGSVSEDELGKYQILPFLKYHGVRQIDLWFVTHADQDHISGLLQILESGYHVEKIVISDYMLEDDNKEMLFDTALAYGADVVCATTGDKVVQEDYRMDIYTPKTQGEDRNEASLVLKLKCDDYVFWFTGDIGQEQEQWLLTLESTSHAESEIVILKSAHHGSKYSNSELFLEELNPELVVISCGKNNLYGHPHQETLDRILSVGSRYVTTMEAGEITFVRKKDFFFLRTKLP